jgi:hypothetical protein
MSEVLADQANQNLKKTEFAEVTSKTGKTATPPETEISRAHTTSTVEPIIHPHVSR